MKNILAAIITVIIVIGLVFLKAWAVTLLWNWVAVGLFNAPVLSYWLAFGLLLLCSLLVKSQAIVKKSNED